MTGVEDVPLVSFIIVARNAAAHLPVLLEDVERQDYPPERMELLLVDSMSGDVTPELMARFAGRHPAHAVRVLRNPGRTLACGWNVALARCRGAVIVRVDAHGRVPPGFVRANVEALRGGEYIAGGERTTPAPETAWARLLALAERSPFGSGAAGYRRERTAGYVPTLAHAAYRREVFAAVGGYDERLGRTEDNEMHYRMRRHGFRFAYSPAIRSQHRARPSLRTLLRQKYGNGYWIGLTLGVAPRCFSAYHLVPAAFTAALIAGAAAAPGWSLPALLIPYAAAALYYTAGAAAGETGGMRLRCGALPFLFLAMHAAYGLGTLAGLACMPAFLAKYRGYRPPRPVAPL